MPKDGRGWHGEPARHALAAKGMKTTLQRLPRVPYDWRHDWFPTGNIDDVQIEFWYRPFRGRPGQMEGGTMEICHFWINPKLRGRGLGKAILRRLEKEARRKKLGKIMIWAASGSEGFYKKHGYEIVRITGRTIPRAVKEL